MENARVWPATPGLRRGAGDAGPVVTVRVFALTVPEAAGEGDGECPCRLGLP
ncbi:hypothetical protein [Streptomyces sp. NBC_00158]|uniref:hypothetical protein n=1 Tax=Streptomyces sp. NBC_00158 TaxID=2903627 RepID=UPI003243A2A6